MQLERKFVHGVRRALDDEKHRSLALDVLWGLIYFVQWNTCECQFGKQEDLAEYLKMRPQNLSKGLKVLEEVGAIKRAKVGNRKRVLLTPEGIFRGPTTERPKAVEMYQTVVPFARTA